MGGEPCGWAVPDDGGACTDWASHAEPVRVRAARLAAMVLWAATGRRYGQCEVTVQPAPVPWDDRTYRTYPVGLSGSAGYASGAGLSYPVLEDGVWRNRPGGGRCGGRTACEVWLDGPTTKADVLAVRVAGQTVPPEAYVVADGHVLLRVDGECWPVCNRPERQDPPGFEVTYRRGEPLPGAVQAAYEVLACEYGRDITGGECRLPRQLSRLSRQGVDLEVIQLPADLAAGGPLRTGIKEVDDVIMAVNPGGLRGRPVVLSPDVPAGRMLT